jgi:hypothetical protein
MVFEGRHPPGTRLGSSESVIRLIKDAYYSRSAPRSVVPMARNNPINGPEKAGTDEYSIDQIDDLERRSLDKANKAISAIENAMAVWEASQEKPEDLKVRMIRLKYFYDSVINWEKKALRTIGSAGAIGERVERLKEFAEICFTYA